MKYMDEYRDRELAQALVKRIKEAVTTPIRLMEICGTHTMAIFKHGIRSLLGDAVELISGPGCPVCVTSIEEVDCAVKLARTPNVIVTTFGDMIRVPGTVSSLQEEKAQGADVRVVYSTFDALKIAKDNPDKSVAFLGIGFETTAPTVAASIKTASDNGIENFCVLSAHKLLPPAMHALLQSGQLHIDGFICPGHVTTVIGTSAYEEIVTNYNTPCVVVGFEPVDILQGILMLAEQLRGGRAEVQIQYVRGVQPSGNQQALKLMHDIFEPCDAPWRGLGIIPDSGLAIRPEYRTHNARTRFDLEVPHAEDPPGCRCAEILKGSVKPPDCKLFRTRCTPRTPIGPCMVSSEGTCAAYFKYYTD
ncbi:MAG: hydrogenase formation protein HypD [Deltaproteobacteria bacterium]|nr:hydrogenase formation protein HypD [Deltaproteobacteria bacterium]MBW2083020.1 hydrogenase formation protein HypD [Deltaproteobacteria bacterium]HDM10789.1 hydrogenase formation protein HypD [Desulfobacteraceae bacterium]